MELDLDKIEQSCTAIWTLVTELRSLVITAKEVDSLDLTQVQKVVLKNKFIEAKQNIKDKVSGLLN